MASSPNHSISVIIPAINERDMIETAVRSARNFGAAEIIVADGGSTDGTLELAERLQCRTVSSVPGRARQLNAGAKLASGQILLFLHADCRLPENAAPALERLPLQTDDFYGGFYQQIMDARPIFRWIERGNAWRARHRRLVYGDQGLFVSRSLWNRLGPFPEVPLMEDYLLSRELGKRVRPIVINAPLQVSARRWQQRGAIRQTIANWSIVIRYRLGWDLNRLARDYRRHDQSCSPPQDHAGHGG